MQVLSADDVGQIIVWDRHSGRRTQLLERHPETVRTITFSADGRWLASGCDSGQLWVWRFGETTPRVKIRAHQDYITDVKWIDSRRLATVGDGVVKIWDVDPVTSSDRPDGGETKPGEPETPEAVRTFPPAPGTAYGIAISPDRSRLACVSASGSNSSRGLVRLFDLESGALIDETLVLQKAVSVCFHPADFRLFVGGQHGLIDVFDSRDLGQRIGEFVGHTSNVYRLTCSPDGRQLASASKDATIRIWDLGQDTDPWVIQCHQERVGSVDFSPVEPLFVSAGGDGTMRLFRTDRRPFGRIIPDLATPITAEGDDLATDADFPWIGILHPPTGTAWTCSMPNLLQRFDLETGELRSMGSARRQELTVSEDGLAIFPHVRLPSKAMESKPQRPTAVIRQVDMDGDGTVDRVAAFGSSELMVWQRGGAGPDGPAAPRLFGGRPKGRNRLLTPRDHDPDAVGYFLEPYLGQLIASWRTPEKAFASRIVVPDLPRDALIRVLEPPDDSGTALLVAQPTDGVVWFCPPAPTGGIPDWNARIAIETGARDISAIHAFGLDDPPSIDTIVVAHGAGMIDLYRVHAERPAGGPAEKATDLARPGDNTVEVDPPSQGVVTLRIGAEPEQRWDTDGEIWALESIGDQESVRLHAAGPRGVYTLTLSKRDGIWSRAAEACASIDDAEWARPLMPRQIVYDIRQDRIVHQFHPLAELDAHIVIAPVGDRFAVADGTGMIRLFSIDGTPRWGITGLHPEPKRLAFSADGTVLCASDGDDVVVYGLNERRLLFRLRGHSNGISGLAVSPDGDRLATASRDLAVRLWSLTSGQPEATFVGHLSPARKLCFSPDGTLIVSADDGGVVKFWDLESKSEMMELHDIKSPLADLRFGDPRQLWALGNNDRAERPTAILVGRWNAPSSD